MLASFQEENLNVQYRDNVREQEKYIRPLRKRHKAQKFKAERDLKRSPNPPFCTGVQSKCSKATPTAVCPNCPQIFQWFEVYIHLGDLITCTVGKHFAASGSTLFIAMWIDFFFFFNFLQGQQETIQTPLSTLSSLLPVRKRTCTSCFAFFSSLNKPIFSAFSNGFLKHHACLKHFLVAVIQTTFSLSTASLKSGDLSPYKSPYYPRCPRECNNTSHLSHMLLLLIHPRITLILLEAITRVRWENSYTSQILLCSRNSDAILDLLLDFNYL